MAGIVVLFLAFALPLYVDPSGADPFRLPKLALLQTAAMITACLLAASAVRRESWLAAPIPPRPISLALGSVVAITVVTAIFSTLPTASWKACITVFSCILLFSIGRISLASTTVVKVGAISATLIAGLTIVDRLWGWGPWGFMLEISDPTFLERLGRATLLGNPNDIGCYLALWLVLILSTAQLRPTLQWPLALVLFGGLLSAGSTVAVFAGASGVTTILLARPRASAQRRFTALCLAAVGLAALFVGAEQISRAGRNKGTTLENLTSHRWGAWATTAAIASQHPLLGVGPGALARHFADERVKIAALDLGPFTTDHPEVFFGDAHSDYLQVLAESGLLGFGVMLWCLTLLVRSRRCRAVGVTLAVLALAMFPLQLAVMTGTISIWAGAALREEEK